MGLASVFIRCGRVSTDMEQAQGLRNRGWGFCHHRRCWFSGVQVWTGAPPPAVLGLQLSEPSQPPSLQAPVPPNKPFYAVGSVSLETPMQGMEGK